jgi:hypothetical protein
VKSLASARPLSLACLIAAAVALLAGMTAMPERSKADAGCPYTNLVPTEVGEKPRRAHVPAGADAVQLCRRRRDGNGTTLAGSFYSENPKTAASLARAFNRLRAMRPPTPQPCAEPRGGGIDVYLGYGGHFVALQVMFGGCRGVFDEKGGASLLTSQLRKRLVRLSAAR